MSDYYQKGRADAAKGVYKPPEPRFFASDGERDRMHQAAQEYREGYNDKRREMGKN